MLINARPGNQMRSLVIKRSHLKNPEGSALITLGDTIVSCCATIEEKVPPFLRGTGQGWITAEYAMLPRSTAVRVNRERGNASARSLEIQRLIGRSLRSILDPCLLGERTVRLDCDVIQADGSTRTAAVSGAFVALTEAVAQLLEQGVLEVFPLQDYLAAVSVGLVGEEIRLDLCQEEDAAALVDMNVVMTGRGDLVEIQGTAEQRPFTKLELDELLALAALGIEQVVTAQKKALGPNLVSLLNRACSPASPGGKEG